MKLLLALTAALSLAGIAGAGADARADKPTIRRFAYLIGANDGGARRVKLRYAGSDARRVGKLLTELGGVAARDVLVTDSSDPAAIERGFAAMSRKLSAARRGGARLELIVYYSGHSDDRGLLLGGDRLSYSALRERIRELPADVHIAILDSCASGAFTRSKGGDRVPAFLRDESSRVSGYAFITSSSADEVAQESDRIASSFFTHYLVSGLRGGADSNRDGRVTLSEAYQFAFAETVSRTASTVGGAQHPAYDMHLVGSGDVVMTDLRSTSAAIVLAPALAGRLFIRSGSGQLVLELTKQAGRRVVLGLGPGTYAITLERGDQRLSASVTLARGGRTRLGPGSFVAHPAEPATARGDTSPAEVDYQVEPIRVSVIPQLSTGGPARETRLSLNIVAGRTDALGGLEIGGAVNIVDDRAAGLEIAGAANIVNGPLYGLQIAGAANVARDSGAGGQVAGAVNVAGDLVGAQVAGAVNVADEIEGLQLSGAVNAARRVSGLQLGVVNAAGEIDGLQLGVVNVADEGDAGIGLINVVRHGYHALELWSSETGRVHVGTKLGHRYTYTLLSAALDQDRLMFGLGLGVHLPRRAFYVDIDATGYGVRTHQFDEAENDLLAKLRVAAGLPIADGLTAFAGLSLTGAFAFDGKPGEDPTPFVFRTFEDNNTTLRLSPGLFAGVSVQ